MKYIRIILYTTSFIVIIMINISNNSINLGCKKDKSQNKNIGGVEDLLEPFVHSHLTYEKYISLMNSNDYFSNIEVGYYYYSNGPIKDLHISGGRPYENNNLNSITAYEGILSEFNFETIPTVGKTSQTYFTPEEMSLIFNYLTANQGYFFNGDEYIEFGGSPYESQSIYICNNYKNFGFTLVFMEPNGDTNCWTISKCVDEYPAQEHPLHDLFDLLENNFISQFE